MHNLLVTGGAGFIGANFVLYWRKKYPDQRIVVLDALTYAGNPESLAEVRHDSGFSFIQGDIRDSSLVEKILIDHDIDTIVHFAAESHVDRSIHGPDLFLDTNINGTHVLLRSARRIWLKGEGRSHRFHHVSTDEVYGSLGPHDPPFTEKTPYAPNSPYSASKAASDHLVRAYHHTYGLQVTTSNCSNNYGPFQFPEKLIPLILINILENQPLPIYGDGLNIRDWLYVEDHCRGIDLVLQQGRVGEVYNLGGVNEWTNLNIVRLICGLLDERFESSPELGPRFPNSPAACGKASASLITFVTDRPGHDRRYAIDAEKCRTELGYIPKESFESGIQKTVDWYLNHEEWWRRIVDGSYRDWLKKQYGT